MRFIRCKVLRNYYELLRVEIPTGPWIRTWMAASKSGRMMLEPRGGFEGVPFGDFDFPPTMVLRFENRHLTDVSSEFQSEFDRQIAQVRAQLASKQLDEFKQSDGKLEKLVPAEMSELRDLMTAKIGALEIVWAYLYSGREPEAWRALAEMWPASDFERIRASIAAAQTRGIRSEMDGVASPDRVPRKKRHIEVFDLAEVVKKLGSPPAATRNYERENTDSNSTPLPEVTPPQSIYPFCSSTAGSSKRGAARRSRGGSCD